MSTLDATNGTGFASICILEPVIWMTFPTMEAEISNEANEAVKGELLSLQKFKFNSNKMISFFTET